MGFCWYQVLAVWTPILLDNTASGYYSIFQKMHNITQYYWYYSILLILLDITDITQYYWYYSTWSNIAQYCWNYWNYSILHAKVMLEWSWSHPGYCSVFTILLKTTMLPILPNYRFLISINTTQYYIFNITQYYVSNIHVRYYIILSICFNHSITYSILPSILNPKKRVFSPTNSKSICVNITQYYQPFPIFINIRWATWSLIRDVGDRPLIYSSRCNSCSGLRPGQGRWPKHLWWATDQPESQGRARGSWVREERRASWSASAWEPRRPLGALSITTKFTSHLFMLNL